MLDLPPPPLTRKDDYIYNTRGENIYIFVQYFFGVCTVDYFVYLLLLNRRLAAGLGHHHERRGQQAQTGRHHRLNYQMLM
jgi:hypothetical protein